MKHIKLFENYDELTYKTGDYVLCNWKYNKLSKIIFANTNDPRTYDYLVESLIESTGLFEIDMIDEEQIERKLNTEEILKFDIMKNTEKYNI